MKGFYMKISRRSFVTTKRHVPEFFSVFRDEENFATFFFSRSGWLQTIFLSVMWCKAALGVAKEHIGTAEIPTHVALFW
jgi:hypothetical protein